MSTLASCVLFWSFMNGISPSLTNAVISVESNFNPYSKGTKDDSGLLQIRAKYVPYTAKQLYQSCTNVMVGTALLAAARKKCKHTIDKTWINCYNLGIRGGSRLRYPKKWRYYKKVIAKMEE